MSFSGSISNALSGMRMSTLAAELVSSNLANATNEDYAARSLMTSSRTFGNRGGVKIDGIARSENKILLNDWREANSGHANSTTKTNYLSRVEELASTPDDPASLSARLAKFETALVSASSRPDQSARLDMVARKASDVSNTINRIADRLQETRTLVENDIEKTVKELNHKLNQVADLNVQIGKSNHTGSDASALMDLRKAALDDISSIVPVRVLERAHDAVALVSKSGAILLEGTATEIDFESVAQVTEHMSLADGQLNGLQIADKPLAAARISGGRLEALFAMRDEVLPEYQAQLDHLAGNLIERLQSSSVDPTLSAGDAGLFTDSGGAYQSANLIGISHRIAVTDRVDPAQGGNSRMLRDGLLSTVPGPVGDNTILSNMVEALARNTTFASGPMQDQNASVFGHAANFMSRVGSELVQYEANDSFANARLAAVTEATLREGVDTDQELQTLMSIEKAYAANAQVLRTVDEMLDVLMGL